MNDVTDAEVEILKAQAEQDWTERNSAVALHAMMLRIEGLCTNPITRVQLRERRLKIDAHYYCDVELELAKDLARMRPRIVI